jgi:hypothetical protein
MRLMIPCVISFGWLVGERGALPHRTTWRALASVDSSTHLGVNTTENFVSES